MGKAEEIRAEQEKAERAVPIIVEHLKRRSDSREVAARITEEFDLEPRKAYEWVVITEEKFDRSQKRVAGIGIAILCFGFALIVAGTLLWILDSPVFARPLILGIGAGVPIAAAGLVLGVTSRRLARVR